MALFLILITKFVSENKTFLHLKQVTHSITTSKLYYNKSES